MTTDKEKADRKRDEERAKILLDPNHQEFENVKFAVFIECEKEKEKYLSKFEENFDLDILRTAFDDYLVDFLADTSQFVQQYQSSQGSLKKWILNIKNIKKRCYVKKKKHSKINYIEDLKLEHSYQKPIDTDEKTQLNTYDFFLIYPHLKNLKHLANLDTLPTDLIKPGKFLEQKDIKGNYKILKQHYVAIAFLFLKIDWNDTYHCYIREICKRHNPTLWGNIPLLILNNWQGIQSKLKKLNNIENVHRDDYQSCQIRVNDLEKKFYRDYNYIYSLNIECKDETERIDSKEIAKLRVTLSNHNLYALNIAKERAALEEKFTSEPLTIQDLVNLYGWSDNLASQNKSRYKKDSIFEEQSLAFIKEIIDDDEDF